jgi:hypothetical protein
MVDHAGRKCAYADLCYLCICLHMADKPATPCFLITDYSESFIKGKLPRGTLFGKVPTSGLPTSRPRSHGLVLTDIPGSD